MSFTNNANDGADELSRLKRALAEYPGMNKHQLQARKVCIGVIELADSYADEFETAAYFSEARRTLQAGAK